MYTIKHCQCRQLIRFKTEHHCECKQTSQLLPYCSRTLKLNSLLVGCVCVASVCHTPLNLLITYTQPLDNLLTTCSCDVFRGQGSTVWQSSMEQEMTDSYNDFPIILQKKMLSANVLIIRMLTVPSNAGDSGGKGHRLKRESSPVMLKWDFNDEMVV